MIDPLLLDELLFCELLYARHKELCRQRCRSWQFKAAYYSWIRARHYQALINSLRAAQDLVIASSINQKINYAI